MQRSLAFLCAASLSILLSGCFVSDNPKFPASSAVPALGDGGRYALFERTGSGDYSSQGTLRVRRRPDGVYEFQTDKDPGEISFHALDGERWIGQSKNTDGGGGYGYVILTRSDREFFLYYADCHKQDRALLAEHGVVLHEHTCSIDAVSDPARLFARLAPGEPTLRLVPE